MGDHPKYVILEGSGSCERVVVFDALTDHSSMVSPHDTVLSAGFLVISPDRASPFGKSTTLEALGLPCKPRPEDGDRISRMLNLIEY